MELQVGHDSKESIFWTKQGKVSIEKQSTFVAPFGKSLKSRVPHSMYYWMFKNSTLSMFWDNPFFVNPHVPTMQRKLSLQHACVSLGILILFLWWVLKTCQGTCFFSGLVHFYMKINVLVLNVEQTHVHVYET